MANEYFGGGYDELNKREMDLIFDREPDWNEEDAEQFLIELEKEKRREEMNNKAWDEYLFETKQFTDSINSQIKIVHALLDSIQKSFERREKCQKL